ncbi:MAG: hypothetical protein MZV64_28170 [Ignavibacteriales bacterium]|nr:hypothetical protein [Ignavibacteriales bacterium]
MASVLSRQPQLRGPRATATCKTNYLASPPLVVAYALAGTMDIDLTTEPLGTGRGRRAGVPEGHLADRSSEVAGRDRRRRVTPEMFTQSYAERVRRATSSWQAHHGARRASASPGTPTSTYVAQPAVLRRA